MTEPKYVTLPTGEKRQEAIDAYTRAVGRVSGAWNYLHGTLGELFAVVIGGDAELVIAKWRLLANDRAQRKKLRAAINAACPERWKQTPTAPADLLWVLERVDELSIVRNDAIYAPVMLHIGAEIVEVNVALHTIGERDGLARRRPILRISHIPLRRTDGQRAKFLLVPSGNQRLIDGLWLRIGHGPLPYAGIVAGSIDLVVNQ
jgi:hypothetical protein